MKPGVSEVSRAFSTRFNESQSVADQIGVFGFTSSGTRKRVKPSGSRRLVVAMAHNLRRHVPSRAKKSIRVECSNRIEPHGAQRRDVASRERDKGKHESDAGEGEQIRWRHAIEQSS